MAFLDDLKNVFSTKTPEQIYAENVAREIKQLGDRTKVMVEMSSQLGMCERKFKNIIQDSRINAIRRRADQVGDVSEKKRIHDAVIGLLAVQEARFELSSITSLPGPGALDEAAQLHPAPDVPDGPLCLRDQRGSEKGPPSEFGL